MFSIFTARHCAAEETKASRGAVIGPVAHSYGGTALKAMVQGQRRSRQGGQGQQPPKGVRTAQAGGKALSVCTLAASYLLRTSLMKGKNCCRVWKNGLGLEENSGRKTQASHRVFPREAWRGREEGRRQTLLREGRGGRQRTKLRR